MPKIEIMIFKLNMKDDKVITSPFDLLTNGHYYVWKKCYKFAHFTIRSGEIRVTLSTCNCMLSRK